MFACDFQTDEFGAETLMMYTYQSPGITDFQPAVYAIEHSFWYLKLPEL